MKYYDGEKFNLEKIEKEINEGKYQVSLFTLFPKISIVLRNVLHDSLTFEVLRMTSKEKLILLSNSTIIKRILGDFSFKRHLYGSEDDLTKKCYTTFYNSLPDELKLLYSLYD